jgi:hypothetical protein
MAYEGQYNPKLVTCSIAAPSAALGIPVLIPGLPSGVVLPFTLVGKAADNFFSITNTADMVSMITGADGNTTHVINNDESGNFSIVIRRGSIGNRVLSILFRAQRLIGQGQLPPFTFPVTVRDNNATPPTTHAGFNCMILRQPDDTFGASDADVTWGFVAATLISNFSSRPF